VPIGKDDDNSWQELTSFYPDRRAVAYKALAHLNVKEYTGRRKSTVVEAGHQLNIIGTFTKDGVTFYCPRSPHDEHFVWRYGIPMHDDDGNANLVKITDDLPNSLTLAHLFELWVSDAKAYLKQSKVMDIFFRKDK
jgi:hypothetical protein